MVPPPTTTFVLNRRRTPPLHSDTTMPVLMSRTPRQVALKRYTLLISIDNPSTAMPNPPTSPLLRLPAELRNLIYSYIFSHQTFQPGSDPWGERINDTNRAPIVLALLRVNRQLHAETRFLPYQNFTFAFASSLGLDEFVARRSQEQLDFIQSVQIKSYGCVRMLQDEKLWELEQFRSLARMPALKHIDVGMFTDGVVANGVVVKCSGRVGCGRW